ANILAAKSCRALRMLDLTGNPVEKLRDFRPFCVFHVRELEFLCGQAVEESDVAEANDKFGGRLDHDFLLKTPHSLELSTLRTLTLVTLPSDVLPLLERLDLSNNNLSCLWGLHTLPSLKTLRLSFNLVSSLRPPNGSAPLSEAASFAPHCPTPASAGGARPAPPFPALRMLLLDNNRLASAKLLGLREMPRLSSLFLQQNDLDSLDGLQGVATLRFLVVDENKIQQIGSGECRGLISLEELWVESNRLSQLFFAQSLRGFRHNLLPRRLV
ncbi:Dystrobrevin beta, partial [Gryllus bimaculatus]